MISNIWIIKSTTFIHTIEEVSLEYFSSKYTSVHINIFIFVVKILRVEKCVEN